jgi:hypothetical protein
MTDKQAKELRLQFCKYGQGHVFKFWEILSSEEQLQLLQQAKSLNLDYLSQIIDDVLHKNSQFDRHAVSTAPAKFIKFPNSEVDWQKCKETIAIGNRLLGLVRLRPLRWQEAEEHAWVMWFLRVCYQQHR